MIHSYTLEWCIAGQGGKIQTNMREKQILRGVTKKYIFFCVSVPAIKSSGCGGAITVTTISHDPRSTKRIESHFQILEQIWKRLNLFEYF